MTSNVNSPTTILDIEKFERRNSETMFSLNVFGVYGKVNISVVYLSKFTTEKVRRVVNLLFVKDEPEHIGHFMTITNITRLLGKNNHHQK
jgi:hypothetical protein